MTLVKMDCLWTWFARKAEERCETGEYPVVLSDETHATTPELEKDRIRRRAALIEEAFRKQVTKT